MLTDEKVAAGFKAAGERISEVEEYAKTSAHELRRNVDEVCRMLKTYSKAFLTGNTENGREYKRFWQTEEQARSFGELILKALNRKAMGESTLVGGGVLVPEELSMRIIDKLGQYGKYRKNATIVPMGSDRVDVPKIETDLTIYCPGEGGTITKSDMEFRQVGLTVKTFAALCAVSNELTEDSILGVGEIIALSMTRSMTKKEDLIGFVGDGTETYFGMTGIVGALRGVDATIANIKGLKVGTGNLYSELLLDDFEGLVSLLPDEADDGAKWYVHRLFFFTVMQKLARAAGAADMFSVLSDRKERYYLGYPVEFVSAMPSVEANSQICALLGDLQLGAYLGERKVLTIEQSSDHLFANNQIAVRGTERVDINAFGVGDTTEAGPIVGLITAAS
ncbi:MAG: phage major capsid protein [Planctomycetota bacterium]|jgi:HK97 family phage major capsid protein